MNHGVKLLTRAAGTLCICFAAVLFFHRITIKASDSGILLVPYSDSEDYGEPCSEQLLLDRSKERIRFHYRIGEKREFPYIGFALQPENSPWNLLPFDRTAITVDPELTDNFTLLFGTFVDGFTDTAKGVTYRLYEKNIDAVSPRIVLSMNEFQTPVWWFAENHTAPGGSRRSLEKTEQIRFQNHPLAKKSEILRIQLRSVTFYHSPMKAGVLLLIGALLCAFPYLFRTARPAAYVPLQVADRDSEELEILEEYLGKEYARLDISLQKTVLETGLSETAVRSLLKKYHRKGFKEYLNGIRMTEGARLIRESGRQIAEIALFVGFRHPTTFTKIFREQYGVSPSEYRENFRKKQP